MAKKNAHPNPYALAGYWTESTRPLVSLAFIAPMLVVYECGLLLLGPKAMRNGADVWLRHILEGLGFSQYFLLPLLTCGILLSWHHVKRQNWKVRWIVLYGMMLESAVLGVVLLLLAHWHNEVLGAGPMLALSADPPAAGKLVAYVGAGIYEELLFRLMLIPAISLSIRWAGASRGASLVTAVMIGSLLFAAAHYRIGVTATGWQMGSASGEPFEWLSFAFRALAGAFFSVLFVYRGFGVAAGTHALYDILVAAW